MAIKKVISSLLAASLALTCAVPVFARKGGKLDLASFGKISDIKTAEGLIDNSADKEFAICNSEGDPINTIGTGNGFRGDYEPGHLTLEGVNPSQTLYIYLGPDKEHKSIEELFENSDGDAPEFVLRTADLANDRVMNLRTNITGDGKDLVAGVSQYSSKAIGKFDRGSWLKVMLFDMAETEEQKVDITATFTTKSASSSDSYEGNEIDSGYSAQLRITLWINNTATGGESGSGESEEGDRIYYTANSAGGNDFIWGDNRAALTFSADSDPDDFYCRMSDHIDNQVYADYGDPANAELWFFDFVTHPTIPSAGRATLTLGIPWDDDDDYKPDPETCRIYQQDVLGKLVDVTDLFEYSEDSEPIPGWSMRTRKLESYVISDVPLPVEDAADNYSDIYFYSDEELDRIFAIDPAESLRIQASYIGNEVQNRLLEILKGGVGGSDAPNRVDEIIGNTSADVADRVDTIMNGGSAGDVAGRVDEIVNQGTSLAGEVDDILAGVR